MTNRRHKFPKFWHRTHTTATLLTCGLWAIVYAIHYALHTRPRHH